MVYMLIILRAFSDGFDLAILWVWCSLVSSTLGSLSVFPFMGSVEDICDDMGLCVVVGRRCRLSSSS
jgi:hypothetical protein